MSEIRLRLGGSTTAIDAMLAGLRNLPQTEHVEELGAAVASEAEDDSSSAGLSDDTQGDSRVVTLHTVDDSEPPDLRGRMETVARETGVVVEWLAPF